MRLLTRKDVVGADLFDSIRWAFEEHLCEPDNGDYHFAVLYGNEDSPDRIDFYSDEPQVNQPPRRIWERELQ
jgi:hypothetical protein